MISLTIVATLSAVGIILSIGLLIAPGATAFLVTKQFDRMLIIAVIVTFVSGFIGIYLSFFIDSAPAPTIILVLTGFFIAAFVRATQQSRITASVDGGS
jgi:manganese/iron transport system permease protein